MYRCIERNAYAALLKNVRIYKSLNELYEDIIQVSDLILPNFENIFLVYFVVCSLILCAHLYVRFFIEKKE